MPTSLLRPQFPYCCKVKASGLMISQLLLALTWLCARPLHTYPAYVNGGITHQLTQSGAGWLKGVTWDGPRFKLGSQASSVGQLFLSSSCVLGTSAQNGRLLPCKRELTCDFKAQKKVDIFVQEGLITFPYKTFASYSLSKYLNHK